MFTVLESYLVIFAIWGFLWYRLGDPITAMWACIPVIGFVGLLMLFFKRRYPRVTLFLGFVISLVWGYLGAQIAMALMPNDANAWLYGTGIGFGGSWLGKLAEARSA